MAEHIPRIDFAARNGTSQESQADLASKIDAAFRSDGSIILTKHSIPQQVIGSYFEQGERIFKLEKQTKEALRPIPLSLQQGYIQENIHGKTAAKECFCSRDPRKQDPSVGLWPHEEMMPGFRKAVSDFYSACSELLLQLLECLSILPDLHEDELLIESHRQSNLSVSSFSHYFPINSPLESETMGRDPAHRDLSTLTLHFEQAYVGYQVAYGTHTNMDSSRHVVSNAEFRDVRLGPGEILVSVGYLFGHQNSPRWKSVVHAVKDDPSVGHSYAVDFFGYPHEDARVKGFKEPAGLFLVRKRGELQSPNVESYTGKM